MKTFKIEISGKTIAAIEDALDEAKKRISDGNLCGLNSNDSGKFSFDSDGEFENDDEQEG